MVALARSPQTLTAVQKAIFDFVIRSIDQTGISPTLREIVKGVGLSSNSVAVYNLDRLEGKGLIRRHRHLARGITLASRQEPPDWRQRRDAAIVAIAEIAFAAHISYHDESLTWQECPQGICRRSRDAIAALGGTTP